MALIQVERSTLIGDRVRLTLTVELEVEIARQLAQRLFGLADKVQPPDNPQGFHLVFTNDDVVVRGQPTIEIQPNGDFVVSHANVTDLVFEPDNLPSVDANGTPFVVIDRRKPQE